MKRNTRVLPQEVTLGIRRVFLMKYVMSGAIDLESELDRRSTLPKMKPGNDD